MLTRRRGKNVSGRFQSVERLAFHPADEFGLSNGSLFTQRTNSACRKAHFCVGEAPPVWVFIKITPRRRKPFWVEVAFCPADEFGLPNGSLLHWGSTTRPGFGQNCAISVKTVQFGRPSVQVGAKSALRGERSCYILRNFNVIGGLMKKVFAMAVAAAMAVVPSFAAVELSGDFYVSPISSRRIDFGGETGKDRLHELFPVGTQLSATFFFGEMKTFNVGLNLGLGWDRVRFVQHDGRHRLDGGWNAAFQAGPAFEFSFGRHSLFVSPGAFFNVMNAWDERGHSGVYDSALSFEYGVHINGAYRFWVVQREKFNLALNFGADYSVGRGRFGYGTLDDSGDSWKDVWDLGDWCDVFSVQRLKVYTGVTFRLGK
ncbi:MAG: hypothetical protein HDR36_01880 [Treponema sp.]|nr:hypothetical protein [Treponema sp.]